MFINEPKKEALLCLDEFPGPPLISKLNSMQSAVEVVGTVVEVTEVAKVGEVR